MRVVGRSETMPPEENPNGILHKWRIKIVKTMFVLKTTIGKETLEHIWDDKTLKEV